MKAHLFVGGLAALLIAGAAFAQTRGGSATVGVEQDIPGFDPLVVGVYDTGAVAAAALVFDTLTRIDDNGVVQPRLALSWSASADFKTWTFKLRPAVTFHDGSPFNAAAVAANYRRMMDPDNRCACNAYLGMIQRVEAVDELTVIYRLRSPSVELPGLISPPTVTNVIHSPKAMAEGGKQYNRKPVGTGPFRLKSWISGDQLVFERNPSYWATGKPYLDRVTVRPMRDPGARMAALRAGDVDIIWHDIADDIVKERKAGKLRVTTYEGSGVAGLVFNTKKPHLDDVRVRQALRYAVDLRQFTETVAQGLSRPATDPYGPGSSVQCKDTGVILADVEKAKALLKDYGKPVTLKFMVTAEPRGRALGQVLQEFWKAVGITVTLEEVDQTTFVTKSLSRDFEIGGWRIIDLADPDPQMYANFKTGSPLNTANYSNAEVDKLLDAGRMTADKAERNKIYCRIAEVLNKEVPWSWGSTNQYYNIAKPGLMGVHKQFSNLVDVSDAWWDKGQKK
ncbi:MAG: ABC transporter substrate-binding protein [Cytophagales bacterium]|nr:ABC transporter substrate-binding protein [Rhizobacter sp.]